MLDRHYRGEDAPALLRSLIEQEFPGRIAVLSSFGAESALLLSLVAEIDRAVPVIFLDTGKLFVETLAYVERLTRFLDLRDVRRIEPADTALAARDPQGELWDFDSDACCRLRKVEPLAGALAGFDAVISGRKRYQGGLRFFIPKFEAGSGHVKIDPLADWAQDRVDAEIARRDLPRHPLASQGYPSIGCAPCTLPVAPGADSRSGRWAGRSKTECGIHLPALVAL
jgi:phosphoadenosine phosphosulfate reductase